jgi:hypothetical protein
MSQPKLLEDIFTTTRYFKNKYLLTGNSDYAYLWYISRKHIEIFYEIN